MAERTPGARLGMVVAGSLSAGLDVRLDGGTSVEDVAVGRYVVIEGARRRYFGMITDVLLGAASPQLASAPPDVGDPFVAEVLAGTGIFGMLKLMPMLTLSDDNSGPQPVKTVPSHYAAVREAGEQDVADVFGAEDEAHFHIGQPLDMETKVCLDLRRLVERSSGIFGKSGTGKTFLTRLLLAGIIQRGTAVNLVFDMHSEHGWAGPSEGQSRWVKGLKQLFPGKVAIFTLDPESSRKRGAHPDHVVEIGYDQIEPDDLALLRDALGMTEAQIESVIRIARKYGEGRWLEAFLGLEGPDRDALAQELGLNPGTLQVLHRKMDTRLARLPFLKPRAATSSVQRILDCLGRGMSVILEFGRHRSLDAYMLVANILSRRIHERYVEMTDEAMGNNRAEPRPLVITIEEAHKFLNPKVADFTIFGTIARELRKYNVTLLVVDQRPSSIADEIMSQIGTRITCLLDDEHDTNAVLSGIPGAAGLRAVLAKLDSKQQALLLGHAVPMPVVVRTRDYGTDASYEALRQFEQAAALHRDALRSLADLYRDGE